MSDQEHTKLLGTYRTPRFKYGDIVMCEMRGEVAIVGLTNARIPWPKCRSGRTHAIILYGDLAEAVRRESAHAVAYWFGVGMNTVWTWRKALDVERENEGTRALLSRITPDTVQSAKATRRRMRALKSPERGAKIAAAKRGVPRSPETIEKMRQANLGKKASNETRAKMSESRKSRGTHPPNVRPFTPDEDKLLGTATDREIAEKLGRDVGSVWFRRKRIGVAAFGKR